MQRGVLCPGPSHPIDDTIERQLPPSGLQLDDGEGGRVPPAGVVEGLGSRSLLLFAGDVEQPRIALAGLGLTDPRVLPLQLGDPLRREEPAGRLPDR